jgi:hypothetical protein
MIGAAFRRWVLSRRWLAFVVLCAAFAVFGACTLNLFVLLRLNLALVADHGVMALMDGAAQQFFELLLTLVAGMAAYVVFKACEHSLVQALAHPPEKDLEP